MRDSTRPAGGAHEPMAADRFAVTAAPLDAAPLTAAVVAAHAADAASTGAPGAGAVSTFLGLVRDQNAGRRVTRLEYEAYEPLALRAFAQIADEAAAIWPATVLGLHHRTGPVAIGEASIVIVAASAHRAAAFAVCRYAIERVKQIAPIWKHEYFEGGDVWIEGAVAAADDAGARAEAERLACA
jgi:molybdopterin synthase catalytic subunit